MRQSIARALRRLADRFDPAGQRTSVTNITVNNCRATEDGTGRDVAAAQQGLTDAYQRLQAVAPIKVAVQSENKRAWDDYMENHAPPTAPGPTVNEPWQPWGTADDKRFWGRR